MVFDELAHQSVVNESIVAVRHRLNLCGSFLKLCPARDILTPNKYSVVGERNFDKVLMAVAFIQL